MTWLINEKIDFLINENRYHYDSLRDQIIEQRCDIKRLLCELLAISNGEAPTITVEELKKKAGQEKFEDAFVELCKRGGTSI